DRDLHHAGVALERLEGQADGANGLDAVAGFRCSRHCVPFTGRNATGRGVASTAGPTSFRTRCLFLCWASPRSCRTPCLPSCQRAVAISDDTLIIVPTRGLVNSR